MSQVYIITLKVGFKDEQAAIAATKQFIATYDEKHGRNTHTEFGVEQMMAEGVDTETIEGLIRVIFAGWKANHFKSESDIRGKTCYTNTFNAMYSWEQVMIGWFHELAYLMTDVSYLNIEMDNDYDEFAVFNGKVKVIH